ncbi:hypothetical protein L6452_33118 [Arctium lappa]|uniref:Uncharacterized protein n=1 Tax=Arctium lappa TaxID=4217 RepID=A0ACB8Z7L7_ARCLA|nr:hypothetical protein L6452_33118 [Arctium lappa]
MERFLKRKGAPESSGGEFSSENDSIDIPQPSSAPSNFNAKVKRTFEFETGKRSRIKKLHSYNIQTIVFYLFEFHKMIQSPPIKANLLY